MYNISVGFITNVPKVITSSFAAVVDGSKGNNEGHTYSENDWNPITEQQAIENPIFGYRGMNHMIRCK